jgi:DNA-binding NtrC family response regulator
MNAPALPYIMSTIPQSKPDLRNERPNILVVDDEDQVRDLMTRLIGCHKVGTLSASNAREALALFEECPEQVHAVVTDMNMPGMSGLELSLRLREMNPNLPVLMVSGNFDDNLVRSLMDCRNYHLLRKPFTLEQFTKKLGKMLPLSKLTGPGR